MGSVIFWGVFLSPHASERAVSGAPRSMKIGTILSPCRYDVGASLAIQPGNLRRPAIPRYAPMLTRNNGGHLGSDTARSVTTSSDACEDAPMAAPVSGRIWRRQDYSPMGQKRTLGKRQQQSR